MANEVEIRQLPTAQTVDEVAAILQQAYDALERVVVDTESVARLDEPTAETPAVNFAKVGVVAAIADDTRRRADELLRFAQRLQESVGGLSTIRELQAQHTRLGSANG